MLHSVQFLAGSCWFTLHQLHSTLYLGSAGEMLRSYGDVDGRYMQYLTASLGLALPCVPLISRASDVLGVAGSMQAVTVLAMVHAACCLVPSLPFHQPPQRTLF